MHVVINQANALFGVDAENKLFAPAEETITFDVTFNTPQASLQGLSVALLSPDGQTLAHSIIEENKAVLNTNTIEAVAFVSGYSVGTEKMAFIVIGESSKPLAIIAVNVSPNPLADIAPPSTLAPTYPTSESLRAILLQMTEQADRAEDAVEATEKAQKAVAQYVDVTFPTKVQEAEKRLENATTSGVNSVTQRANQAVDVLNQKQTAIVANIDTKAQAVSTALDTKLTTANTAINVAVERAETAKSDAVRAQGEASKSASQASTSASNASKSASNAKTSEDNAKASANTLANSVAVVGRWVLGGEGDGAIEVVAGNDSIKVVQLHKMFNTLDTAYSVVGDGEHWIIAYRGNTSGCFIYDKDLRLLGSAPISWGYIQDFPWGQSCAVARNGRVYGAREYYSQPECYDYINGERVSLYNTGLTGVVAWTVIYNDRTNHVLFFDGGSANVFIFDADLNLVEARTLEDAKSFRGARVWYYAGNTYVCKATTGNRMFMLDDADNFEVCVDSDGEEMPFYDKLTTAYEDANLVGNCTTPMWSIDQNGTFTSQKTDETSKKYNYAWVSNGYQNWRVSSNDASGRVVFAKMDKVKNDAVEGYKRPSGTLVGVSCGRCESSYYNLTQKCGVNYVCGTTDFGNLWTQYFDAKQSGQYQNCRFFPKSGSPAMGQNQNNIITTGFVIGSRYAFATSGRYRTTYNLLCFDVLAGQQY